MSSKQPRSRTARRRGPDLDHPLNKAMVDTPGFSTPKIRRRLELGTEERQLILQDAYRLAQAGHTEFEIAQFFGIDRTQLWRWKQMDPAFNEALKIGSSFANDRVKMSLYHRAIGYSFQSEKIFNNDGMITRAAVIEHVPPDVTSMIFWLKNRDPDNWADVNKTVHSGSVEVDAPDPRKLAMAVMAALREGLEAPVPTIEHKEAAE